MLNTCGFCLWFTGLSGAGKTTLQRAISEQLQKFGIQHENFDADELRQHVCSGLGFSLEDRMKNVDRIAYLASLPLKYGGVSLVSCISPLEQMRDRAREQICSYGAFIEIFVHAPLEVCEARDPKGLYKKAREGKIQNFTAISSPYENPLNPELTILTAGNDVATCTHMILEYLNFQGLLRANTPRALFVGRWQPFHKGHDYIIRQQLDSGMPVAIGVRNTPLSPSDPLTARARIELIREIYKHDDVIVFPVPDIQSINIGRNVGYSIVEYDVPDTIAGISATELRNKIRMGNSDWTAFVPEPAISIIERSVCDFLETCPE